MNNEKRITWLYNPEGLNATQQKLHPFLLNNTRIANELEKLDEAEQAEFSKMLTVAIDELNDEHTRLMVLMGQLSRMPAKQLVWENNHLKITKAIVSVLSNTGRMPNQMYIAQATGLSRQTVNAHMLQGDDNSVYAEHQRQYAMMAPRVMDAVLEEAMLEHNMKAAKLYFEILEKLKGPAAASVYNTPNNFVYVNNYVIRQETLSRLSPDQLKQIVEMVKQSTSTPEHKAPNGSDITFMQFPD